MPCRSCGAPLDAGDLFCSRCGARVGEAHAGGSEPSAPTEVDAAGSLPLHTGGFHGTERFRLLSHIGSGSMGAVYSARDAKRDETVALKTFHSADPTAIYDLKKEFRALAEVAHPNLITLYELVAEDDQWFFTMELVDGVDFLSYVRPQALDVERLRSALRQAAAGVAALHSAGKLHRDLKPSNVLVDHSGRVVILDFGIAVDLSLRERVDQTREEGIFGTVEYLAPEQATGEAVKASDWYTLGVMLYEALTGQLPFSGAPFRVLTVKQMEDPQPPDDIVSGLPADLVSLCVDLMARDPASRPTGDTVLNRLGMSSVTVWGRPKGALASDACIIGREKHLKELHDAFDATRDGRAVTVFVHGLSGSGKSTLVDRFLHQLVEDTGALVLSGRCYVRESMPYKSLDGVIDSLSRFFRAIPTSEVDRLLSHDMWSIGRLFPVLGRVEGIADIPKPERPIQDPVQLRRQGFAALRELFRRIRAVRPVVVYIDDLQWGDADSIVLLEELFTPLDAPALLFVASFRDEEVESHPFLGQLLERVDGDDVREIPVSPLTEEETRALALHLLQEENGEAASTIDAIVRESDGIPFLVELLARHALTAATKSGRLQVTIEQMLEAQINRFPAGARLLLETLAVAARPLDSLVARDAAGLEGDERPLVTVLRNEQFLRLSGTAELLELYHDRIREGLAQQITGRRVVTIHRRLVRAMEARGVDDPEIMLEHYLGANELERAGTCAVGAGDKSADALAFQRAAAFYQSALELLRGEAGETHSVRVKLAEVLANAGRGVEAATAYLDAARSARDTDAVDLQRLAAEQLLRCGHVDRGLEVARSVLRAVGLRLARSPKHAFARLLLRRLFIRVRGVRFTTRPVEEIDPTVLSRLDTCWTVAVGLARIDNIRAQDFQALNLILSLRSGEPSRVARSLAVEAAFASLAGGRGRKRTAKLVRATRELAERIDDPAAIGRARLADGIANFFVGEFVRSLQSCEAAVQILKERCAGVVWEINTGQTYTHASLFYLGEFAELARRVPVRLREAREHGDLYASADVAAGRPNMVWLVSDDVATAREELHDSTQAWPTRSFHLQHYLAMLAEGQIDLYAGEPEAAWLRTTGQWGGLSGSMLLRIQGIRLEALHLRARCALAVAAAASDPDSYLKNAGRDAARIRRQRMAWADPLADLVLAGVAAIRSDGERAAELASRAVSGFARCDMAGYAAAARRRHGRLIGGSEGDAEVAAADEWMASQNVVNPERLTQMLAPGFPDRAA